MIIHGRVWKPIDQFEGYYASCYGDILSLLQREPCVLKQSKDSKGYAIVNIGGTVRRVHRLVCAAFIHLDLDKPDVEVLHVDDNPLNNNISNLRLGSHRDNLQDMTDKGRRRGPPIRLSDNQVRTIRTRFNNGEKGLHLAKSYGVSPSLISSICNRTRRYHVV